VSEAKEPIEDGRDLETEFVPRTNVIKDDRLPNEAGRDPVSEYPVNEIDVTNDDTQVTPVKPVLHNPVGTPPEHTQFDILELTFSAAVKSHIIEF